MTRYRLLAITAASLVALTGCNYGYESDRMASTASNNDVSEAVAELNDCIESMLELTEGSGNDEQIREKISQLIDMHSAIYEDAEMAKMDYYQDMSSDSSEEAYDLAEMDYYVADDALYYAFSQGYKSSYSDLFTDYVDMDYMDYYGASRMTLERCEKNARSSFESANELEDEYYDAVYSDDADADMDELRLECAQVYLDVINNISEESFYGTYDRDYTPDDIIAISDTVYESLLPVYNKYIDLLMDIPDYEKAYDAEPDPDPFGTIRKYAPRISPSVAHSADRICNEKLYTITSGDNALDAGYTIDLPKDDKAWIYNYADDYSLLGDCIHEFGHFHAALLDDTGVFNTTHNMDIGEMQSQALEIIFMQFYDEIYGGDGKLRRIDKLLDLMDSVIFGFAVGEFEATVFSQRDELTAQEVVDLYSEIVGSIDSSSEFCYIDHLFTQPGYFISYGVSALASFSVFDDVMNDPSAAAENYDKLAAVSCKNGEYSFRSALEHCGIDDVLTKEYVEELASQLMSYAETL